MKGRLASQGESVSPWKPSLVSSSKLSITGPCPEINVKLIGDCSPEISFTLIRTEEVCQKRRMVARGMGTEALFLGVDQM